MSDENKEKESKVDEKKENKEEKNNENIKSKLEERIKRFGITEENNENKKLERAKRFGLVEKEGGKNENIISTEEELKKRKERFKDELEEVEKAKGERGRIRYNNNHKKSHTNFRKRNRDFSGSYRRGKRFPNKRIRGGRRNNSYRK